MNSLVIPGNALPSTSPEALGQIFAVQQQALDALPPFDIQTEHVIHGGMYARTIRLAAGTWIIGALIKVPTMLIVSGKCRVFVGGSWAELEGYQVIAASKGRKQVFVAYEETAITVVFRTDAKTVEAAEAEFTDEAELLVSRHADNGDLVTITGE